MKRRPALPVAASPARRRTALDQEFTRLTVLRGRLEAIVLSDPLHWTQNLHALLRLHGEIERCYVARAMASHEPAENVMTIRNGRAGKKINVPAKVQ